jgi:phage shock protein A
MRNQLVQVKTQVATAIAEEMKLKKRGSESLAEANLWLKRAEQAVQQENENAARDYLARYNDLVRQEQRYAQQTREHEQLVTTLRGILRQLEAKISEVDTTIELLASRKRSALLQQRIYDTLSKSGSPRDKEKAERAQDRLLEVEARARALADLQQHDLDSQLTRITQEQVIEDQLQQLKQKNAPRSARKSLSTSTNEKRASEATPTTSKPDVPPRRSSTHLPNTGELAPAEAAPMDLEQLKRSLGM